MVMTMRREMNNEERDLIDRVVLVHLLHFSCSRARCSVLLFVSTLFMDDESVLECAAVAPKGAKAANSKAKLLPLVTPCHGAVAAGPSNICVFEMRRV